MNVASKSHPSSSTDRIEKTIVLHAPRSKVWRALTDYQEFGQWFGVILESPFQLGEKTKGNNTATYPSVFVQG